MLVTSIFVEKIHRHCKKDQPSQIHLAACCKEILAEFKFDCVFLAYASAAEEELKGLAFDGREEVMDN
jgi:hypothetical protein